MLLIWINGVAQISHSDVIVSKLNSMKAFYKNNQVLKTRFTCFYDQP